jgi:hypothetical protein
MAVNHENKATRRLGIHTKKMLGYVLGIHTKKVFGVCSGK